MREEKIDYLLAGTALVVAYVLLYSFRYIDDNTFTSWYWVFLTEGVDALEVAAAGIVGIVAAYLISYLEILEKRPRVSLFLLSFLIGVIFWRSPEAIIDASRYFTYAKDVSQYGVIYFLREWGVGINPWTDLPVMPFIYGLLFKYLGETRVYPQLLNTLMFSATVVLTYSIGRRLWNESIGLCAGLLLLAIPYLHTQVPLLLVDVPTMFYLTLAIYATVETVERKSYYMAILSSFAIFLSFYTKFSTWAMLSVIPIIFLLQRSKRSLKMAGIIGIISGLLIFLVFLYKGQVILGQLELLRTYQRPMLEVWEESHVSTFFYQFHPLVTFFLIYSLYHFIKYKRRDAGYIVVAWLPIVVLLLDVRRIRYLIPVFPMFALMASYGIQRIEHGRFRSFLVLSAVFFSLAISALAYLSFIKTLSVSNLQEAGKTVDGIRDEYVLIFSLPPKGNRYNPDIAVPIFDLYSRKEIIYQPSNISPPSWAKRHPLRFTWEYRVPEYYKKNLSDFHEGYKPVVIVISQDITPLPQALNESLSSQGYKLYKEYSKRSVRPYQYRTMVRLYMSEGEGRGEDSSPF